MAWKAHQKVLSGTPARRVNEYAVFDRHKPKIAVSCGFQGDVSPLSRRSLVFLANRPLQNVQHGISREPCFCAVKGRGLHGQRRCSFAVASTPA
jgi:hypothetical protein